MFRRRSESSSLHFLVAALAPLIPSPPVPQMVCEQPEVFASACALARAFPLFTHRSGASRRLEKKTVTVEFFLVGQDNGPVEVSTLQVGVWKGRPGPWAVARSGRWEGGRQREKLVAGAGARLAALVPGKLQRLFQTQASSLCLSVACDFRILLYTGSVC